MYGVMVFVKLLAWGNCYDNAKHTTKCRPSLHKLLVQFALHHNFVCHLIYQLQGDVLEYTTAKGLQAGMYRSLVLVGNLL